jgi:hypothetical protein
VFMLSPKQKVIQHLEIVAINIHTLIVIVSSVIMLCFECVADWFVTFTADGSCLEEAVKRCCTCVSVGIVDMWYWWYLSDLGCIGTGTRKVFLWRS